MGLYASQPLDRLSVLEERINYLEKQLRESYSSNIEDDFEKVDKPPVDRSTTRPNLRQELIQKIKERRKRIEVAME
jgi:hypothetical protein